MRSRAQADLGIVPYQMVLGSETVQEQTWAELPFLPALELVDG